MLTREQKKTIIDLRKDKATFENIAKQAGCSVSSAKKVWYKWTKENIKESQGNNQTPPAEQIAPIQPQQSLTVPVIPQAERDHALEFERLKNELSSQMNSQFDNLMKRLFAPPPEVTTENPTEEEVEMESDRMKYTVWLNPEMWYYYSIFKARAQARNNPWKGDFGAFCELGIREMFKAYNITPMVKIQTPQGTMYTDANHSEEEF